MRSSTLARASLAVALVTAGALAACSDASPFPAAPATGAPIGGAAALTVTPSSAQVGVNERITLTTNAGDRLLEWTSGAPAIATVDGTGVVVGLSPGVATISVRVRSDTTQQAQATITVVQTTGGSTGTP